MLGVARDERIPEGVKNLSGLHARHPAAWNPPLQSSDANMGVTKSGSRPDEGAEGGKIEPRVPATRSDGARTPQPRHAERLAHPGDRTALAGPVGDEPSVVEQTSVAGRSSVRDRC